MAKAESMYKRICSEMDEAPILIPGNRSREILLKVFLGIPEHTLILAACILAEAIANCGNTED